jgi:hypothetical protein
LKNIGIALPIASAALAALSVNNTGASNSPSVTPTPKAAVAAVAAPANVPVILNATTSARPGDIVSLQGAYFGSNPSVRLDSAAGAQNLAPVNQVADWIAVKIPASARGAIALRIANGSNLSAAVYLNSAKGYHFDALKIVPGGSFRIFGRNLQVAGATASVTIDGKPATITTGASDEHMLTVTAPDALAPKSNAIVTVDNGNGSGATQVERTVRIVAAPAQSPFDSATGWTGTFRPLTARSVEIACSGGQSISQQISEQIQRFGAQGGIIQLSAGNCTLDRTVDYRSNIVIQGQGKWSTVITYTTNYALYAENLSNIGLRNLTLKNVGQVQEGPIFKTNEGVIFQNVVMDFGTQRQSFFSRNYNMLVSGCDFFQRSAIYEQSPYVFDGSKGLIFINNYTEFQIGAPSFQRISDAYIANNTFARDASAQNHSGVLHMLTIDFASRIAVTGNTFTTVNGSITNHGRNDGESILTEGGGAARTENLGTVSSAAAMTLFDPTLKLNTNPFGDGIMPENYGIAIVSGKGAGQTRYITGFSGGSVTVDRAWDIVPDATSKYSTFVWGIEKSLLMNNKFQNMPRGIWLYQTATRDIDIIGNQFSEGGGIYLRSYQNMSSKMFDPMFNIRISENSVTNKSGQWPSYMSAVFVNSDALAFGTAMIGISFDGNAVVANKPNISLATEEYAGNEGYLNIMRVENYDRYERLNAARILGTIFTNNSCTNCAIAYRIGTGSDGTVIAGARNTNVGVLLDNARTTAAPDVGTNTVIQ